MQQDKKRKALAYLDPEEAGILVVGREAFGVRD
jgi:hypothetical protein